MRFGTVVIFLLCAQIAIACLNAKRKGKRGKGNNNNNLNGQDSISRLLGNNVKTSTYDNSGFDNKNGIASGPSDLNCNFETACCWKNEKPPGDTLDWATASGSPDQQLLKDNFQTSLAPSGNFLVVGSDKPSGEGDSARLKSCTVQCAQSPIIVKLSHWATKDVLLQVCTQDAASESGALTNCQDLSNNGQPGPTSVTLPASRNVDIIVVASNLESKNGNVAIIDDITVDYQSCSDGGPQTTTTSSFTGSTGGTGGTVCQAIVCNFEAGNPCSYSDALNVASGASRQWSVQKGRFENPLTGIRQASDGNYYTAVYLKPNENAGLQSNTNFDQERVIRFDHYRATDEIYLRGCCDGPTSCPYDSHKTVQISDFDKWKTVSFTCPKGTKTVLFMAKNEGPNQGAVGLDNINVLIPSGGSPEQAQQTAC